MEMNTKSPSDTEVGLAVEPPALEAPSSRELLLAAGGMLALLMLFDLLGRAVGWIGGNLLVFVAATFLLLPDLVWPAGRTHPTQADRPRREQLRGVSLGAVAGLIILMVFLPGYHLWNTRVADRPLALSLDALAQPANELNLRPTGAGPADLTVERDGRDLLLHWRPQSAATLALRSDGNLTVVSGSSRPQSDTERSAEFSLRADQPLAVRLRVEGASQVAGTISPSTDVWLGIERQQAATSFEIPYNLRWILWMLLMQVVLVAIPEETFFRGYLQRRLALRWPHSAPRGFFHISRANLVTSAVFALAHFVIGFQPGRLAVFFPSLLFGRLAERSGGLAASVTLHILSNLMMQLASTQYLP